MKIVTGLGHVARYALGAALSWLVFPVEAVLIYVALLLGAAVFDLDPGGPLAGPMLILIGAALGVAVTALVTFPAILLGDLVARRRRWFAAPVAAVTAALALLAAYVWGWGIAVGSPVRETAVVWGSATGLSLLPLLTFVVLTYASGAALALGPRSRAA